METDSLSTAGAVVPMGADGLIRPDRRFLPAAEAEDQAAEESLHGARPAAAPEVATVAKDAVHDSRLLRLATAAEARVMTQPAAPASQDGIGLRTRSNAPLCLRHLHFGHGNPRSSRM